MEQNGRFLDRTFGRFLWPTVLSVLGGTVNVMVDSILVGNLLGQDALAAINLCTPVYLLLCTLGSLIASGAGILSSLAIGREGEGAGRRYYTLAFFLLVGVGLACSAAGLLLLDGVVGALGAAGPVAPMVRDYVRVTLAGGVFKLLLYLPFQYLRLDGRPGLVTGLLLLMTCLNGALDVFFMAGLGLGMTGAALASVLATAAAVAAGLGFLHQRCSTFHLERAPFTAGDVLSVVKVGSPAALNNFLSALRLVALNHILLGLGGSALVAVFALVNSMGEFSLALVSGVPQTAAPLLGVYAGERDTGSIRRLMARQLRTGLGLITVFAAATAVLARPLCGLFGLEDPAVVSMAVPALGLFAGSLPMAMVLGVLISYYNTLGRIALADALTAGRVFLFAAVAALALARRGDAVLVWLYYPLSELCTLAVWPLLCALARRGEKSLSPLYLLDETLEREGKSLNFSVESDPAAVAEASERIERFCADNAFTPKQTMAVSLSIEEMLTLIVQNCFAPGAAESMDVRIFCLPGTIGLRIRNGGAMFNPLRWYEEREAGDDGMETLGIKLIQGLAQVVTYRRTFGVNTLIVLL